MSGGVKTGRDSVKNNPVTVCLLFVRHKRSLAKSLKGQIVVVLDKREGLKITPNITNWFKADCEVKRGCLSALCITVWTRSFRNKTLTTQVSQQNVGEHVGDRYGRGASPTVTTQHLD